MSKSNNVDTHEDPCVGEDSFWSKLNAVRPKESQPHDPFDVTPAASASTLHQWSRYASYCQTFSRQIDWRDVMVFRGESIPFYVTRSIVLHEALTHAEDDSNSNSSVVISVSMPQMQKVSTKAFEVALMNDSRRRYGTHPLCLHQQRLYRWTRDLAQFITRRLVTSQRCQVALPPEEILMYRVLFASKAASISGQTPLLRTLFYYLEIAENEGLNNTCSSTKPCDSTLLQTTVSENCVPLSLTLTVGFPSSSSSVYSLLLCLPKLLAQTLENLWNDTLHVSWELIDPKSMAGRVEDGIVSILDGPERQEGMESSKVEASFVHSDSLRLLFTGYDEPRETEEKNPLLLKLESNPSPVLQQIQPHQVAAVVRLLETAGYVMLTKIYSCLFKPCYNVVVFLSDFYQLVGLLNLRPERHMCTMLNEMNHVLLKASEQLYVTSVQQFLAKFNRTATKNYVQFKGREEIEKVSYCTLGILEHVVEPTLVLLGMIGPLTANEHRVFAMGVIGMMKDVISREMVKVENNAKTSPASRDRCFAERSVVMEYIDAHPVSLCLRNNTSGVVSAAPSC